jgi:hypothetical protein
LGTIHEEFFKEIKNEFKDKEFFMLKISVLTPNYSAIYAKEFELTVLFNSIVKMILANLLSLVIDLVKVKNATL